MNNAFANAVQNTPTMSHTANGAVTYASSLDKNVDLFFLIGATRKNPEAAIPAFIAGFAEDQEIASRILLWSRDARGGAGEREVFRKILAHLSTQSVYDRVVQRIIPAIPLYGRWDDLFTFVGTRHEKDAFAIYAQGLKEGNQLAAKWAPRQGKVAVEFRKYLGLTPKSYRKMIVKMSNTVEQKLCAKLFSEINYSHVPSVAAHRYQSTFARHDKAGYEEYRAKLVKAIQNPGEKPEAKINASVLYPHQVVQGLKRYGSDKDIALAQWEALPNFLADKGFILPMADVSGSMGSSVGGTTSAMNVSVGLSLYLADKQVGPFKDMVLTFSENSKIQILKGNIVQKCEQLSNMEWGMSTNLQSAFAAVLSVAMKNKIAEEDMLKFILIISDMEFNSCGGGRTNFEALKAQYQSAGYELPRVVFWNVMGRLGNSPVTKGEKNVALISGFSPSIAGTVLSGDVEDFTPASMMKKVVMAERYNIFN